MATRDARPRSATGYLRAEFGIDEEAAIKAAVRRVRGNTMTSFERLATLWQQVRYLDRYGIAGAFVECGTWRGGSVGMMALAHLATEPTPRRPIHLFDSFEGLPEPTAKDGAKAARYAGGRATGALDTIDACTAPLEDNRALLEGEIGYPRCPPHLPPGDGFRRPYRRLRRRSGRSRCSAWTAIGTNRPPSASGTCTRSFRPGAW